MMQYPGFNLTNSYLNNCHHIRRRATVTKFLLNKVIDLITATLLKNVLLHRRLVRNFTILIWTAIPLNTCQHLLVTFSCPVRYNLQYKFHFGITTLDEANFWNQNCLLQIFTEKQNPEKKLINLVHGLFHLTH